MWTIYHIRWDFITQLCSSVPANPEIVDEWVDSQKPAVRPPGGRSLDEIGEEVMASLGEISPAEIAPRFLRVFQRDGGILVQRAATVKAHLKECARVLSGMVGKIQGETSFAVKVVTGVYEDAAQYWIPILDARSGVPMSSPTGMHDKAIHVRGPRGPQNALKRFEYCLNARMEFRLKVLTPFAPRIKTKINVRTGEKTELQSMHRPSVTREDMIHLMEYGGVHGYAGERGDGEGRYIFTILKEEQAQ